MAGVKGYICKCKVGFAGSGKVCGKDSDIDGIPDESISCNDRTCKAVRIEDIKAKAKTKDIKA
jgi:syndecan 4